MSNLYNLHHCWNFLRLPPNIGSLINIQHLNVDDCSLQEMPQQIGKLKNLQTLSDFIVGESGFLGIKELKHLSHLWGKIHISQLENVMDIQDARDANLRTKLNLEEFDDLRNEDIKMEVLSLNNLILVWRNSILKIMVVDNSPTGYVIPLTLNWWS